MTRRPTLAHVAAAASAALVLTAPVGFGAQQREVRERSIAVSVVTGEDTPLTNLTAADFTIREDGIVREVLRASTAPLPSHLVLLVDDSQVTQTSIQYLRTGLTTFVKRIADAAQGLPADATPQWAMTTFGDRPTKRVEYNQSEIPILRGIERLFHQTGAGSTLIDAIIETTRDLRKLEAARPLIVTFVAEDGPEFGNRTHKDVATALEGVNASLWVVALQTGSQNVGSTEARERAIITGDVVKWSGGATKVVITPQAIDGGFVSVANQILTRYSLTYGRPESLVPPSKLEVAVKRRDGKVRSARWAGR